MTEIAQRMREEIESAIVGRCTVESLRGRMKVSDIIYRSIHPFSSERWCHGAIAEWS